MNKNPNKVDDRIDRFLQAEEDGLKPKFSNAKLASEVFACKRTEPRRGIILAFSLAGLAACVAFAFLSRFSPAGDPSDSLTQGVQVRSVEPLLDSDKELLEDLLVMPQEMNWVEALPDEATLDLLVMLDQPFE